MREKKEKRETFLFKMLLTIFLLKNKFYFSISLHEREGTFLFFLRSKASTRHRRARAHSLFRKKGRKK